MKLCTLLALGGIAFAFPSTDTAGHGSPTLGACTALKIVFKSQVFFPGDANYTSENQHFWIPTDYLSPTCVFTPKTAAQASAAIIALTGFNAPFAVRGGGHMPIPGYANTNGGVLIGLTNLNQVQLSKDKSTVSVGPGRRWGEVYEYLEPYGLVTLGGRVGIVGVPGLLLGGGISFYSNQHGFASDNVAAFEVVLASGKIVTATSTQNSDLFWALKGGGNSFWDLCAGILQLDSSKRDIFLGSVANYGKYGSADAKSAVIPSIFMLASINTTFYTSALFYDGTQCAQPALQDFNSIPAIANTYGPTTLSAYVKSTDALIGDGTRQVFRVVSSLAAAVDPLTPLPLPADQYVAKTVTALKLMFAQMLLFWSTLWGGKFSLLVFFRQLVIGIPKYMRTWLVVFTLVLMIYLACMLSNFLTCVPLRKYWSATGCSAPEDLKRSDATIKFATSADIFADLLIMALPLRLLWTLRISMAQKFGFAVLFCLGSIVIAFAFVRLANVTKATSNSKNDPTTLADGPVILSLWSVIEASVGVIVCNLPAFRSLLGSRKIQGANSNRKGTGYPTIGSKANTTRSGPRDMELESLHSYDEVYTKGKNPSQRRTEGSQESGSPERNPFDSSTSRINLPAESPEQRCGDEGWTLGVNC